MGHKKWDSQKWDFVFQLWSKQETSDIRLNSSKLECLGSRESNYEKEFRSQSTCFAKKLPVITMKWEAVEFLTVFRLQNAEKIQEGRATVFPRGENQEPHQLTTAFGEIHWWYFYWDQISGGTKRFSAYLNIPKDKGVTFVQIKTTKDSRQFAPKM